MPPLSGWCLPGPLDRPHHRACRWPLCNCPCHTPTTHDNRAEGRTSEENEHG